MTLGGHISALCFMKVYICFPCIFMIIILILMFPLGFYEFNIVSTLASHLYSQMFREKEGKAGKL